MTTLTFYGGVGEIGGNKIMLKDNDKRVFLDFGMNFEKERKFYEPPFLSPRKEEHLLGLGILPKIPNLYKNSEEKPNIDGILITHPHLDHFGYLGYVDNRVPIYCGETTRTIILAKEFSGRVGPAKEYYIANYTKKDGMVLYKTFITFRTRKPPTDTKVPFIPIHVDHSTPGAYGFILETSKGNIVYTGDLRFHGARGDMTLDFLREAQNACPEVLIIEGTNISETKVSTETEVEQKIDLITKEATGLVMGSFSLNDIDRLKSFYNAAEKNGRVLAISMKHAYLLHLLQEDKHLNTIKPDDKNILIFAREKKGYPLAWEEEIFSTYSEKIIQADEVKNKQKDLVLVASFYDMNETIAISPIPGSVFILSQAEPFNEEMEIDFNKLQNWLEMLGIPMYQIHVSGHAMPHELKSAIQHINPKKVFLVHTDRPELYKRFISDLNIETINPIEGEVYEI